MPRLVPVAVETAQQIRNAAATNAPPDTPAADAAPPSVPMNPLPVAREQQPERQGRQQHGPETALVGCACQTEPDHPRQEQNEGRKSADRAESKTECLHRAQLNPVRGVCRRSLGRIAVVRSP